MRLGWSMSVGAEGEQGGASHGEGFGGDRSNASSAVCRPCCILPSRVRLPADTGGARTEQQVLSNRGILSILSPAHLQN